MLSQGKLTVTCIGMKECGERVYEQGDINRGRNCRGITAEMLKCIEAITVWMHIMCNLAWKKGKVREAWI